MVFVLGVCTLMLTSLSHAADNPSLSQFKKNEKFYIYKDKPFLNKFIASGYMPDGRCVEMNDAWVDNCQDSRSCVQVNSTGIVRPLLQGGLGTYWLSPANNWGDVKGGYNLTGAKKLVFWARGEKGGEVVTFKMGGVGMGHLLS